MIFEIFKRILIRLPSPGPSSTIFIFSGFPNFSHVEIIQTANEGTPMTDGHQALLTCDVWEHAYYIDTRNARPKYLENFWQLVNWEFASKNFAE